MASEKLENIGLNIKFLIHSTNYVDENGVEFGECNNAINELNKIKKELIDSGISWIKELPPIKLLSVDSSQSAADDKFQKVYEQASSILDRLIKEQKIDSRSITQIVKDDYQKKMNSRSLKEKIIDFFKRIKHNLTASSDEQILRNLIPDFDEIHALAKKGKGKQPES